MRLAYLAGVLAMVVLLAPPVRRVSSAPALPVGWVDWNTPNRLRSLGSRCAEASKVRNFVRGDADGLHVESTVESAALPRRPLGDTLPFPFQPQGAAGIRTVLRTREGWLVGFRQGEFGGSLWFVAASGARAKQVLRANVRQMTRVWGRVLVATDLLGDGFRGGALYELGEAGEIRHRAELPVAPAYWLQEPAETILLLGDDGLYRMTSDLALEGLYSGDLGSFSPNSMVESTGGEIYVGLNFFILRLTPDGDGYRAQWLVKPECRNFHVVPRNNCVCDGYE